MKNEPSSALFPELPYQGPLVAEPVQIQSTPALDLESFLVEFAHFNMPLGVVLVCLLLYTRMVQGKPVNPLKWIGWARRGSRK